jgi:hypothetical protein
MIILRLLAAPIHALIVDVQIIEGRLKLLLRLVSKVVFLLLISIVGLVIWGLILVLILVIATSSSTFHLI